MVHNREYILCLYKYTVHIPGSSRYVKFSLLVGFFGEFRHKFYTQKEDPGMSSCIF